MGMDTSGNIYPLSEGEKPKVGDFRIDEREKAVLEQLEAFKRADALREMRLADYPGGSKSAKRRQRKLAAKSRARNRR